MDLWYAEDFPDCAERGDVLDTRTQAEYDAWHIPGPVLIPYTELRERLDEVARDRPVYTYCRSGFRSYIAYGVLKQNGWDDVAFLSGGMMTYHGYHRTPLDVGRAACHGRPRRGRAAQPAHCSTSERQAATWVTPRSRSCWTWIPGTAGAYVGRRHGPAVVGRHHL